MSLPDGVVVESAEAIEDLPLLDVWLSNGQHFVLTSDGRYMISGDLLKVRANQFRNLTKERREVARAAMMAEASNPVVFASSGDTKQVLYVFTDVDCGYCRRFHSQIQQYNQIGLEVRYLAYPRMGLQSQAAEKMQRIWCATTSGVEMTAAKLGEQPQGELCDTSVIAEHYALGQQIPVRGTPTLVTERGVVLSGYHTPEELEEILDL